MRSESREQRVLVNLRADTNEVIHRSAVSRSHPGRPSASIAWRAARRRYETRLVLPTWRPCWVGEKVGRRGAGWISESHRWSAIAMGTNQRREGAGAGLVAGQVQKQGGGAFLRARLRRVQSHRNRPFISPLLLISSSSSCNKPVARDPECLPSPPTYLLSPDKHHDNLDNNLTTRILPNNASHNITMKASFTLAAVGAGFVAAQGLESLPECGVSSTLHAPSMAA